MEHDAAGPREEEDTTPTPPRRSCTTSPRPREHHQAGAKYDDNDDRALPALRCHSAASPRHSPKHLVAKPTGRPLLPVSQDPPLCLAASVPPTRNP